MGILARQSLANAIYTWTGIGLGALLTLFIYPRILDPDQYGLTRVLVSASLIAAQFAHLGMRNSIIRFFPFFSRQEQSEDRSANGLLFLGLAVPLAGYLLFALLFLAFQDSLLAFYSDRSPLLTDFALFILPITLFILYFEVLNSWLRSLRDSTSGALISEVILRLAVTASLVIYLLDLVSFPGFLILFTGSYALQPLLMLLLLIRRGWFRPRPRLDFLRRPLIREMGSYGLFTLFGGLATVVVWNVDILMVSSMIALEQTAIYAISFYIGTVIAVPKRAVEKIATPLVAGHIHRKEWEQVREIYRSTSLAQTIAGLALLLLVWANASPLIDLLPEAYRGGEQVVLLIGLGKLLDMMTGTSGSIILTSRHYRFDLLANLLLIFFTVSMNLLLIPTFGIEGAAAATAFSLLLYNLMKCIYIFIKRSIQPFGREHLIALGLAAVTVGVLQLIPQLTLILNLAATGLATLAFFLLPVWWLGLSKDINRELRGLLPAFLTDREE